jgi:hypothetical protein
VGRVVAGLCLAALAGCATGARDGDVQRATQGPTADEIYMARFAGDYGRLPTFDESTAHRADLDRRVSAYLTRHPEISTSERASQFTFHRRVAVGMSREEVRLLIGPPAGATGEAASMEAAARQFWPAIAPRAAEMWSYPGGWHLYFSGDRLVDVTVTGKPPL